jgi:hypothetical protein
MPVVVGLCLWLFQGHIMTGQQVFEQLVAFADQSVEYATEPYLSADDTNNGNKITSGKPCMASDMGRVFAIILASPTIILYYGTGGIEWADKYIRKTYLA